MPWCVLVGGIKCKSVYHDISITTVQWLVQVQSSRKKPKHHNGYKKGGNDLVSDVAGSCSATRRKGVGRREGNADIREKMTKEMICAETESANMRHSRLVLQGNTYDEELSDNDGLRACNKGD